MCLPQALPRLLGPDPIQLFSIFRSASPTPPGTLPLYDGPILNQSPEGKKVWIFCPKSQKYPSILSVILRRIDSQQPGCFLCVISSISWVTDGGKDYPACISLSLKHTQRHTHTHTVRCTGVQTWERCSCWLLLVSSELLWMAGFITRGCAGCVRAAAVSRKNKWQINNLKYRNEANGERLSGGGDVVNMSATGNCAPVSLC